MKLNKSAISGLVISVTALVSFYACGKVTNDSIPTPVEDLTDADVDPADADLDAISRWSKIMEGLGIKGKKSSEPSSFLGATEMSTKLVGLHTSALHATRCAAVISFTQWDVVPVALDRDGSTAVAAKVYKMKYKLKASTSTTESDARTALVVVPDVCGTDKCPIVAYGHGGDRGLSYSDIVGTFGSQQTSHIIVAPTFPGEPLCKSGVSSGADKAACDSSGVDEAPVGTSIPWDNDVDDLMGVQNCLIKSYAGLFGGSTPLRAAIAAKTRPIGGGSFAALPLTFMAGFSRGALVADLAIARAGAALQAAVTYAYNGTTTLDAGRLVSFVNTKTGETADMNGVGMYTTAPSCSIHVAGPSGSTMGIGRLLAEMVVKGTIEKSNLINLPGVRQLNSLISGYVDGSGSVTKDQVVDMLAKRDVPLNSPLMQVALRNWASFSLGSAVGGAGKMLVMHGDGDKVVPVSDTKIIGNVMAGAYLAIQADATLSAQVPGILPTPVIFKKADANAAGSHHGDLLYHSSLAYQPDAFFGGTDAAVALLKSTASWGTYDGKTPADTLAAWRTNATTGCNL